MTTIPGSSDNDTLYGTTEDDSFSGGAGDDVLYSFDHWDPWTNQPVGGGYDTLDGGAGNDYLVGGEDGPLPDGRWSSDVAAFDTNSSTAEIGLDGWNALTVTSATTGTDTLSQIRDLQFTDGMLHVAFSVAMPVASPGQISSYDSTLPPGMTLLDDGNYVVAAYGMPRWGWSECTQLTLFGTNGDQPRTMTVPDTVLPQTSITRVDALADGGFAVSWTEGAYYDLFPQLSLSRIGNASFSADGSFIGTAEQYVPFAWGMESATARDGSLVVASASSNWDVAGNGAFVRVAGQDFSGRTMRIDDGGQSVSNLHVTPLDDGGYVVTWQASDGTADSLWARRFNANDVATTAAFRVDAAADGIQPSGVEVAELAGGNLAFAWSESFGSGWHYAEVRIFDGANALTGAIRADDGGVYAHVGDVDLAALSDGGFVVVYSGDYSTRFQRFDAAGSATGSGSLDAGYNATREVLGLPDSGFAVAWRDVGYASQDWYYTARYDNLGNIVTPASQVQVLGDAGNNTLRMAPGTNDSLEGGDGNDKLLGNTGNDTLDGGGGINTLVGGAGNDVYRVFSASEVINESVSVASEIDTVESFVDWTLGSNLENLQLGYSDADYFWSWPGTYSLLNGTGNALNNRISGLAGHYNALNGGAGNDTLDGAVDADTISSGWQPLPDTLTGGDGNDVFVVHDAADVIADPWGNGIDTVYAAVDWTLADGLEKLVMTNVRSGTSNVGVGNWLDNDISGSRIADSLLGGGGYDTLRGNSGNDTLVADGDDVLQGGRGNDVLEAWNGSNTLVGGSGDDTYRIHVAGQLVSETDAPGSDIDTVVSDLDWTLGTRLDNLVLAEGTAALNGTGNALDNAITGNENANSLSGGLGNDTLDGGAGNDTLAGGSGNDTYVVDSLLDVMVETGTSATEIDTVVSSLDWTLAGNLENLVLQSGASAAVNGTGSALDNRITGNEQANLLTGNAGNDTLDGGAGNDTLVGGSGDDTYVVDAPGDVVNETGPGSDVDTVRSGVHYTLAAELENLELFGTGAINGAGNAKANRLLGAEGSNRLDGGDGNDTLDGGAGNDTMAGGSGDDAYFVDAALDVVDETAAGSSGVDTVTSRVNWTLGENIENLVLQAAPGMYAYLSGTGNALDNVITAGDDIYTSWLDGGAGNDTLVGGAGNDRFVVDSLLDVIIDTAVGDYDGVESSVSWALGDGFEYLFLTGTDSLQATGNALGNTLVGNAANNSLDGGGGSDWVDGGAGNDLLAGGSGDDRVFGGAGNDTLDGGEGNDTLNGAAGDDTFVIDSVLDVVLEYSADSSATDIDTVLSSVSYTLGNYLDHLTLTGSSGIAGAGNGLANRLTGNAGNNSLTGLDGSDTLDGGAGTDTLAGGQGDDLYIVDRNSDLLIENSDGGIDTVHVVANLNYVLAANLENLVLMGSTIQNGTGNGLDNTISGNAFNNLLIGGNGNDTLDGGAGTDTLKGGNGNDVFHVDGGKSLVEFAGQGADTVVALVAWTLGNNFENLVLDGSANLNGNGSSRDNLVVGNDGNNRLKGNAGHDTLEGGNGLDTLAGGSGNDLLTGGAGADRFLFDAAFGANNVDHVADFNPGEDRFQLENAVFTALTATGTLDTGAFNIGTGATEADDRIIYDNATGTLYYDADGNGSASFKVKFAVVDNHAALTAADFQVV